MIGELFSYKLFDPFFSRLIHRQSDCWIAGWKEPNTIKDINPIFILMFSSLNELKGDFLIKILVPTMLISMIKTQLIKKR